MHGNSFHKVQAKFMEKMSLTSKSVLFHFKYSITKLELQFVLEQTGVIEALFIKQFLVSEEVNN